MGMKLLLADDHTLFRDALVQYIERAEPSAHVLVSKDLDGALEIMKETKGFDLVLLDLRMPGMKGMEGFRRLKEAYPDVKVALMSGVAEPEDVQAALDLGAVGYFPKTLSGKALLGAIQSVLDGQRYVPIENGNHRMMPSYRDDGDEEAEGHAGGGRGFGVSFLPDNADIADLNLTPREKQVLAHLVEGKANKEIARDLDLQVVTVKLHVRGICRKLEAKNRTQAAIKAREMGFHEGAAAT